MSTVSSKVQISSPLYHQKLSGHILVLFRPDEAIVCFVLFGMIDLAA